MKDVNCVGTDTSFICMFGLPEEKIESLSLENVSVDFLPESERKPGAPLMMDGCPNMSGKSFYLRNVKDVKLENVSVAGSSDDAPELIDIDNASINDLRYL